MEREQIIAMAVAAVSEELKTDIKRIRVLSFKEVEKSSLEKYIEEKSIHFEKYQLRNIT